MRSLTLTLIPSGPDLEDLEVTADGFAEEEILDALAHCLIQLRLHKCRGYPFQLIRGGAREDGD